MDISVIGAFKQWLMEDGRAEGTIQSYLNDVQKYHQYLREKDCDPEVLMSRFYFTSYLKQLQKNGMKVNTINKKITSRELPTT